MSAQRHRFKERIITIIAFENSPKVCIFISVVCLYLDFNQNLARQISNATSHGYNAKNNI